MSDVGVRRVRARVTGTVQGVGFRPHVHRLAHLHRLAGWVLNDSNGVLLEAEGPVAAVERFLVDLESEAPPLAEIASIHRREIPVYGQRGFAIVASVAGTEPSAFVSADAATCEDCLRELNDPSDRRFRYPFTNCTNCGPRFSIVAGIPYDRPLTTMATFEMCPRCQAEYDDPRDRRFHAQANACPECGPAARLVSPSGERVDIGSARDPVQAAAEAVARGEIVAIKGLGGFHLACRAGSAEAVEKLRHRKHRENKPFALMVADLRAAHELVELSTADEQLLLSAVRPILVAPRRPDETVAAAVAPRAQDLGVMLPYSPLHHLLLAEIGEPMVLTSGNVSDEPIAYRDEDALQRLSGIADFFLIHDRPIQTRTDDSVLRAVGAGRAPLMLRRSRGYVPHALELPLAAQRPLLACGGDLKSAFCLVKSRSAWVGPHIGDLAEYRTLRSYMDGIAHFEDLFAVAPAVVAHDLHPDYRSTAYALARAGVSTIAVQHHHAHLAACLAEHGELGRAVGAIYDGTGFGPDGTIWGGELLVGGIAGFRRAGRLWAVRMPGGERAVREPWRMACAWLTETVGGTPALPEALAGEVGAAQWRAAAQLAGSGFAAPLTTSAGRLFDAVAALCGLRPRVHYEGQAAIELEAVCGREDGIDYELPVIDDENGLLVLDARPTVARIAADVAVGVPVDVVAARFHAAVAKATATAIVLLAERNRLETAVLTGGVFQNRRLLSEAVRRLEASGLRVLVPERLPPNDGGLSYGQAAVAAATMAAA
ncbi:MAG: carbamoyltransferase HypF [Actinomycetota bacterium]|nr:carbamoyltransferase HypF [Actinomycetota bacterium]